VYRAVFVVSPGLEPVVAEELTAWDSAVRLAVTPGGVEVSMSAGQLRDACTRMRCMDAVRVRVASFEATTFEELIHGCGRAPWHAFIPREARVLVRTSATKSRLYHSGAVEQRVVQVLGERLGAVDAKSQSGAADGADSTTPYAVYVRIVRDRVQLSVDAGSISGHRMGYRRAVGRAPLREPLAAACARLAGLGAAEVICDPFCGSGTLLLEAFALRMALPRVVSGEGGGILGMDRWPSLGASTSEVRDSPVGGAVERRAPRLCGSDLAARELEALRINAVSFEARYGVTLALSTRRADVGAAADSIADGAFVLTNVPYGRRSGRGDSVRATHRRFGDMISARPDLSGVVALAPPRMLSVHTGLSWETLATFDDRGVQVALARLVR